VVVQHGLEERRTPGNTLAVQPDKPYQGLSQFGTGALLLLLLLLLLLVLHTSFSKHSVERSNWSVCKRTSACLPAASMSVATGHLYAG
jgi:hypothetical protein